ncbi:MAG TPA: Uma2 family endonuclease [Polyangiaceae bacterium]
MDADPTLYPVMEKMGEDILHRWIVELLRPLVAHWLESRGIQALVGADQFIYFKQHDPHERISPDVYVLPGLAPDTHVSAWKTWLTGIVPSFALEVVSRSWKKDYHVIPEKCAELGLRELIIFDPNPEKHEDGARWQVYRRVRGRFTCVEVSERDRVRSRELGCYLRAVGEGSALRLRIATGARGRTLFATPEEAERRVRSSARSAMDAERSAKKAALARVAELEKMLAKRSRR